MKLLVTLPTHGPIPDEDINVARDEEVEDHHINSTNDNHGVVGDRVGTGTAVRVRIVGLIILKYQKVGQDYNGDHNNKSLCAVSTALWSMPT